MRIKMLLIDIIMRREARARSAAGARSGWWARADLRRAA
jgi:hypothetical protein